MPSSESSGLSNRPLVIVTGAAGFLGKYVCERLLAAGYCVSGLVHLQSASLASQPNYRETVCDLRTGEIPAVSKEGSVPEPPVLVHLAARIPTTFDAADAEAECNRQMDDAVIAVCTERQMPLVYASTTSVYSFSKKETLRETTDPQPNGSYAASKLNSERIAAEACSRAGIPFAALRISAPYGPGQPTRTVLKIFLERAAQHLPLLYHGDGAREQTFTHAEDVARAFEKAVQLRPMGIYNIAGREPVCMRDLAQFCVDAIPGSQSEVRASGQADPQQGYTSRIAIGKAEEDLRWAPMVTLQDGLREWARVMRDSRS